MKDTFSFVATKACQVLIISDDYSPFQYLIQSPVYIQILSNLFLIYQKTFQIVIQRLLLIFQQLNLLLDQIRFIFSISAAFEYSQELQDIYIQIVSQVSLQDPYLPKILHEFVHIVDILPKFFRSSLKYTISWMCQITNEAEECCQVLSLIFLKNIIEHDPNFCSQNDFLYEILIPFLMTIISQIPDNIPLEFVPNDMHPSTLAKKVFCLSCEKSFIRKNNFSLSTFISILSYKF